MVCNSHSRRSAGAGGRQAGGRAEHGAILTDMPGIGLVGFVPSEPGSGEITDLRRIDDADDMACRVQHQGHAQAVAPGRFQAGMHPLELAVRQPPDQLGKPRFRIGELLGQCLAADKDTDIQRLLGDVDPDG